MHGVQIITYSRNKSVYHVRYISDIYNNISDFNEDIDRLVFLSGTNDKTIQEVINELVESYTNKDTLLFAEADVLSNIKASDSTINGKKKINDMRKILTSAKFDRLILNRCMSNSYGNDCIYLLHNHHGEDWIKNNIGENKIIKAINESQV